MSSPELAGANESLVPDQVTPRGAAALRDERGSIEPTPLARRLLRRLLGLNVADTSFSLRRFRGDHESVRPRLEKVGAT
jgi:hypothetical protein